MNTYEMVLEDIYRTPFTVQATSVEEAYEFANDLANNDQIPFDYDNFYRNSVISCDLLTDQETK